MDQEGITQQETKKEDLDLREPIPQPNPSSYYRFIEGGRVIHRNFPSPYYLSLKKNGQEHIGGCIELRSIRDREAMMKAQLQAENAWLRGQLQERES